MTKVFARRYGGDRGPSAPSFILPLAAGTKDQRSGSSEDRPPMPQHPEKQEAASQRGHDRWLRHAEIVGGHDAPRCRRAQRIGDRVRRVNAAHHAAEGGPQKPTRGLDNV